MDNAQYTGSRSGVYPSTSVGLVDGGDLALEKRLVSNCFSSARRRSLFWVHLMIVVIFANLFP